MCSTKTRQVGLTIIGQLGNAPDNTVLHATGEIWVELRWEPRPHDPADDLVPAEEKWRPPSPDEATATGTGTPVAGRAGGRRGQVFSGDGGGIDGFDSDDSQ